MDLGWMVAIALAVALIGAVALYERELGRLARFLRRDDRSANERATVSFSTPGVSSVAAAVNDEMDALRDAVERGEEMKIRDDGTIVTGIESSSLGQGENLVSVKKGEFA